MSKIMQNYQAMDLFHSIELASVEGENSVNCAWSTYFLCHLRWFCSNQKPFFSWCCRKCFSSRVCASLYNAYLPKGRLYPSNKWKDSRWWGMRLRSGPFFSQISDFCSFGYVDGWCHDAGVFVERGHPTQNENPPRIPNLQVRGALVDMIINRGVKPSISIHRCSNSWHPARRWRRPYNVVLDGWPEPDSDQSCRFSISATQPSFLSCQSSSANAAFSVSLNLLVHKGGCCSKNPLISDEPFRWAFLGWVDDNGTLTLRV